jgi:hypothetical protein
MRSIVGMVRGCIDFLLREAGIDTMAETAAKQLEAYFLIGFRKEITEGITFKKLLISLLPSGDQVSAMAVLEGMVWRFLTGEQEIPERPDRIEKKDIEGLNVTDQLWQAGYGKQIEGMLRNFMKGKLSGKVEPDKLKGVIDTILYKEKGELSGEALSLYKGIKDEMTKYLGKLIENQLKTTARWVLKREKRKAPEEVLEPSKGDFERGLKREKVSPDWLGGIEGLDIEEVNRFVEKNFPSYQYKIFENLVYGNPPMSEGALAEKILREDGKKIVRQNLNSIKFKILDEIKRRFFPGVPQKKPVDVTDIKWEDIKGEEAEDFEEFLVDYLADRKKSEDVKEKVVKFVRELMKGGKLKEISERIGIKESSLKQYSSVIIKPAYEAWIKGRMKSKGVSSSLKRLIEAMEGREMEAMDYDGLNVGEGFTMDYDGLVVEGAAEDKEKVVKYKDEDVEKMEGLIQEQMLDKKDFDVLITFVSDFDWVDIGLGKFDPKLHEGDKEDQDEGWVKDDPHFEWRSFNVVMNRTKRRGKQEIVVSYTFKQKLFDNGDVSGEPSSTLKITRDNGDVKEPGLHDAGVERVRVYLDKFFGKIAEGEIPILAGSGISVKYKNEKLDREYHNTNEFEKQMGGLGISNSKHSQRAKEYNLFRTKRRMHLLGPGRQISKDSEWSELLNFFTGYLKGKGVSSEDRVKVQRYIELLKKNKSKVDPLKMHEMLQFEKKHWEDDYAIKLKEVNPMDALK